jgi:hypothetical protein
MSVVKIASRQSGIVGNLRLSRVMVDHCIVSDVLINGICPRLVIVQFWVPRLLQDYPTIGNALLGVSCHKLDIPHGIPLCAC